jgi:hypothetical protein
LMFSIKRTNLRYPKPIPCSPLYLDSYPLFLAASENLRIINNE